MLSLMIFLPVFTAIMIFFFRNNQDMPRKLALFSSLAVLGIAVYSYFRFDGQNPGFQFIEKYSWFPELGISYYLGIDGLSFPLILLTAVLVPITIYFSWGMTTRPALFFGLFMLIEAGVIGVFSSIDFILFFIFWEIVLIPMFFIIGIWGGERREYASYKFLIYTHLASLVMIIGIFAMYFHAAGILGYYTFSIPELTAVSFAMDFQMIWFPVLFLAFAVKIPIVPFHTWLPDAHVEAPSAGSAILAGVLLKMGTYGMVRVAYSMNPDVVINYTIPVVFLGLMNVVYGALVALRQDDLKKMIAYSSISHMGFVVLGIQSFNFFGLKGAVFQMVAHGLITAALFLSCGTIQYATGTRRISLLQGLYKKMPVGMTMLVLGFFASMGMPGFVGFIGEITVFLGFYQAYGFWVLLLGLGIVLTAGYYLWAFQRMAYGETPMSFNEVKDVKKYEMIAITSLLVLIVFFGLQPEYLFNLIDTKVISILEVWDI